MRADIFSIIEIENFWGDPTDLSAKTNYTAGLAARQAGVSAAL